jgi:uncharacterized membrane protein HdeD (DUF308 family)
MKMSDVRTTRDQLNELTWAWWLMLLVGVLGVVAGVLVLAKPSNSLATLAVICGVFALVDGILIEDDGFAAALLGILGIVIGILLIRHPIHGVTAVALLVGISFIINGIALCGLGWILHNVNRTGKRLASD